MKKIICWIKRHKRGKTESRTPWIYHNQRGRSTRWYIECSRCGHKEYYDSPRARLIGEELRLGFDGN